MLLLRLSYQNRILVPFGFNTKMNELKYKEFLFLFFLLLLAYLSSYLEKAIDALYELA